MLAVTEHIVVDVLDESRRKLPSISTGKTILFSVSHTTTTTASKTENYVAAESNIASALGTLLYFLRSEYGDGETSNHDQVPVQDVEDKF